MKLIKYPLFLLPLLLGGFGLRLQAETASDISQKHYTALLGELQTYIEENPGAEDLGQARNSAIEAAYNLQHPAIVDLLKAQFDSLKTMDPLPREDVLNTGMMITRFAQQHGRDDMSGLVLEDFKAFAESTGDPNFRQLAAMIESQLKMPKIGDSPELKGALLDGSEFDLADYRGKVVFLDFWATWCPPCVAEVPNLKALHAKYADKGFEIIGISADRAKITLETYVDLNNLNWPHLYDNEQEASILKQYEISKFPTTFLLDREGKIIAVDLHGEALKNKLAQLFTE